MAEEVTATFVFTDLVDSTALASKVGPDMAEQIRIAHFAALRGAVEAFGGTEVKNLGDGLMVMFTSARRAVSCAVAMQQAIEKHNRRATEPLSIRVGIAAGDAVLDDGDYFGTPVIEAARLCSTCRGDQILVTTTVLSLTGSGLPHTTREVGELSLKGLDGPVVAADVLWEPETPSVGDDELPGRVTTVLTGAALGFFGRVPELAAITESAATARDERRPWLLTIAGEPGMGKTTLAARAAHDLAADGEATVAFGGCIDGMSAPFQPWIQVVRDVVRFWSPETTEAHRAAAGHALGTWVPELATDETVRAPTVEATDDRLVLFDAVADALRRVPDGHLGVVILDDLQWSDQASVQLLRHVLLQSAATRLLVIVTYRDSDLRAGDTLTSFLADMRRETNVTRIDLAGLSEGDVVDLVEATVGHGLADPESTLAHTVHHETRGNPFFTTALLRHLVDNGSLAQNALGRMQLTGLFVELGLPASVRDVVAHRVERLGADSVGVLKAAAVCGLHFDFDLLVSIVELDEDAVLDVLEEAATASLVVEDRSRPGRFGFVHGLVRDALYGEISATRRRRVHRRVADALEQRPDLTRDDPALLAAHAIAAVEGSLDVGRAVHHAVTAGDAALTALAPSDAARWYRQALELFHRGGTDDAGMCCDLETKLGDALRKSGDPDHRELLLHAAELAETLDDGNRTVAVALALAHGSFLATPTEDRERLGVIERALGLLSDDDLTDRVLLLSILAKETGAAKTVLRRTYAEQALGLARTAHDDRLLLTALPAALAAMNGPADQERLLADSAWAVQAAERLGDRTLLLSAHHLRAIALASFGLTDEREAVVDRARTLLGDSGTLVQRGWHRHDEITLALYRGDVTRAEALATELFEEYTAAGMPYATLAYGAALFVIRELQGRLDEIVDLFVDVAHREQSTTTASAAAAFILCRADRAAEARGVFDFSAEAIDTFPFDHTWTTGMRCVASAVVSLGELGLAELLYERILPFRHLFANSGYSTTGSMEQPLAELAEALGRLRAAEDHRRAAVEANRRARASFWEAESEIELAEFLIRRGNPDDAAEIAELLGSAAATSSTHGFAGLTRRIASLD